MRRESRCPPWLASTDTRPWGCSSPAPPHERESRPSCLPWVPASSPSSVPRNGRMCGGRLNELAQLALDSRSEVRLHGVHVRELRHRPPTITAMVVYRRHPIIPHGGCLHFGVFA